jgi:hypothetical protein
MYSPRMLLASSLNYGSHLQWHLASETPDNSARTVRAHGRPVRDPLIIQKELDHVRDVLVSDARRNKAGLERRAMLSQVILL